VYVDGVRQGDYLTLPAGKFDVVLAKGLDPKAEHTLRLVRRNEAWVGRVELAGFSLDDGAKALAPAALPARKILCVGDSITCGYNIEYFDESRAGSKSENAELTYGFLTAKAFNAQVNLVSYGGKGISRDWRGLNNTFVKDIFNEAGMADKAPAVIMVGDFFERALPDDPKSGWDHSRYVPDLVMICIGQNDFSQVSLPVSEYAQDYIKVVDRIHAVYPNAKVLLLSSPMAEQSRDDGWQPRGKALEIALTLVQQHYLHKGEGFVLPFFVAPRPGTKLDSHPIAPQHAAMAEEIAPAVKLLMGW
jgi:lysophospholipase L1-like esterase